MLGFLIWAAGMAVIIAVIVVALRSGGIRMKDGSIIGHQQTQQEFDERIARLNAREARRKAWLDRH